MAAIDLVRRRSDYDESLDDFPTPPWAVRALMHHVLTPSDLACKSVLEPACGRGHVAQTLKEYGARVEARDIKDYGYPDTKLLDFANYADAWRVAPQKYDWVITNPPYKLGQAFFDAAMLTATRGVALLMKMQWLTSAGRYARIFEPNPPSTIAVFTSRMPATQGKVVKRAGVIFTHVWCVWNLTPSTSRRTEFVWLPPDAQKNLERDSDYDKFPWEKE